METLSQLQATSKNTQDMISRLATREYVDDQVRQVRDTIHQSKPTTQLKSLAGIVGSILVLVTFCGFMFEAVVFLQHIRQSMPAIATAKP